MTSPIKIKGIKKGIKGNLVLPGDKSISHRAVILGALAEGTTKISGFLNGEDCLNTVKILQQMGVSIQVKDTNVIVKGVGLNGLQKPNRALDVGNSGTSFRLLLGVLSGQNFITKITGDASIQKRPMDRVVLPLKQMGAKFSGDKPPIIVFPGANKLRGIKYTLPVASAQVKSALLLAGLYANGETKVIEPVPTRDHTEIMLKKFGLTLNKVKGAIGLPAGKNRKLKGTSITVPADISAAAFFIAAALILPKSKIILKNVGINKTRIGFIEALEKMGAKIKMYNKKYVQEEPVADIVVESSKLKAAEFNGQQVVNMIDEIPIFSVVASFAEGSTVIKDAGELRVKESDRLTAIAHMLAKFGVKVEEKKDGLVIEGKPDRKIAKSISIDVHHDHRIAMAALIMGLRNDKDTTINDSKCIETSFPGFLDYLKKTTK